MKYKVRLNDSIDLIVDANSEVEAVRAAKNVKDAMRARLADADEYWFSVKCSNMVGDVGVYYYKGRNESEARRAAEQDATVSKVHAVSATGHSTKDYVAVKNGEELKRVHRDKESTAEEIRKAQEWVDYDLKHYGEVSEQTKKDIAAAGLTFDKWNNQVHDSEGEEVHDSDQLRKLAYDLAQMANYFDRANSAHARRILSENDKQKFGEFFNLGTRVYEVMKKEVEGMRKAEASGTFKKNATGWDWSDTQRLLYDAISLMKWTHEPKLEALSKKLGDLWSEYRNLLIRG